MERIETIVNKLDTISEYGLKKETYPMIEIKFLYKEKRAWEFTTWTTKNN